MHENRETSGTSRSNQNRDRSEKADSRTADRHVSEESDRAVVAIATTPIAMRIFLDHSPSPHLPDNCFR